MVLQVKQELAEQNLRSRAAVGGTLPPELQSVIELSSSSSDSGDRSGRGDDFVSSKRARVSGDAISGGSSRGMRRGALLPPGFLEPLPAAALLPLPPAPPESVRQEVTLSTFKQFWKAGDYVGASSAGDWDSYSGGMDHVRVHPKFLHSNATSHKWALGAFAELLDNALDEVCNGATYVNMDMLTNKKDGARMLLIEDNGGGMTPDKMRQCMSLGYSAKSKVANTIGQYGNGFKTSTMRLGADVIVFSRCPTDDGKGHTQSIGLLSYTFLRSTGKEDIVVPILDYERKGGEWNNIIRSSSEDWSRNVETIVQWSPFASEAQLLQQFYLMKNHGTRIIIYNLWEDDQGQLELDFDSDPHDIQIRGVNRDEKNVKMAKEFPNSKHYLTYRHSLRSYVSILYLRLPPSFRIILRGKDVEHHNIVNDMMLTQEVTYRPQASVDGISRDPNMVAVVTIGFVKDARAHIDVQGFNVYHKNRLIKPFWRVWNPSGSDGRGVLGLLEANFIEPAHDKQGFERTTVLARLEAKLMSMQRTFWTTYCHKIGYAPRRSKNDMKSPTRETSPEYVTDVPSRARRRASDYDKSYSPSYHKRGEKATYENGSANGRTESRTKFCRSSLEEAPRGDDRQTHLRANGSASQTLRACGEDQMALLPIPVACAGSRPGLGSEGAIHVNSCSPQVLVQLTEENRLLKERLEKREEDILAELVSDLLDERKKRAFLENKLQEAECKIQELNREQEKLIGIFSEERDKRDIEEEKLRKELKEKSTTIQELIAKVRLLESLRPPGWQ